MGLCSSHHLKREATGALGDEIHADNIQNAVRGNKQATRLSIQVSCRNLLNRDMFSKSDTFVVMHVKEEEADDWKEFARTEIIFDNLNPNFVAPLEIDYLFQNQQLLRFEVWDADNKHKPNWVGDCEVSLHHLVRHLGRDVTLTIANGKPNAGTVTLTVEEIEYAPYICELSFSVRDLKPKKMRRCRPFLIVSRDLELGSDILVYRSEVAAGTTVQFQTFRISLGRLCNRDVNRLLHFDVYNWNNSGSHSFIGRASSTLAKLQTMMGVELQLTGKYGRHLGSLVFHSVSVFEQITFLDYIKGGCDLNLVVAIDFTASNGDPRSTKSLHHVSNSTTNDYERAIRGVCDILAHYDSDQLYPAFGFGAKFRDDSVQHCFALNGNPDSPECHGVDDLLAAYHQALLHVSLHGPTIFSNVIEKACEYAANDATQNNQHYTILLIITDGIISDKDKTIEKIVTASHLPLSIIIVGVGDADFSAMQLLNNNQSQLSSNGQFALRKIVQFVPFNRFKGAHSSSLAQCVLQEIPQQFVTFFRSRGIRPNVPENVRRVRHSMVDGIEIQMDDGWGLEADGIFENARMTVGGLATAGEPQNLGSTASGNGKPTIVHDADDTNSTNSADEETMTPRENPVQVKSVQELLG